MAKSLLGLNEAIFANENTAIETIISRQIYVIISILFLLKKLIPPASPPPPPPPPVNYLRNVRKVVKYILAANPETVVKFKLQQIFCVIHCEYSIKIDSVNNLQ